MKDKNKTKEQLLDELVKLRQRIAELEKSENERKRDEEALRESEERLHTVISNAPIIMWALDKEGIFTLSEGKGLKALGLKPGAVVGQSVFDVYRDEPKILENNRRALAGESLVSIVEVGELVYASHYSPVRDENGEVIGMIGVSTDITEQKQAEEALRKSEKQASSAIEAARGFTFSYDIATGKINWGGAIEEITGFTPEEFAQVDIDGWAERMHPDDKDRILSILQEAIEKKDRATAEYRFKTKKDYVTLSSISLTERENGKAVRLVGILQDITERKKAEEKIKTALKEKEVMLRKFTTE